MKSNTILIASAGIIGMAVFLINKKNQANSISSNFEDLKSNLGNTYVITPSGGLKVIVNVNYRFDFFNNNRFSISIVGNNGIIGMGTYSNGGKTLILDSGKIATGDSVWQNINVLLKN